MTLDERLGKDRSTVTNLRLLKLPPETKSLAIKYYLWDMPDDNFSLEKQIVRS